MKELSIIGYIFITFFLISCSDEEQAHSSNLELPHLYRITEQLKSLNLQQKKKIESIGFVLVEGGEFTMGSPDSEIRFREPNERDENQNRVKISEDFLSMIKNKSKITLNSLTEDQVTTITSLSGVQEFPMRVKCATMAWHTLLSAVEKK